jgi:hypothetical protein
MRATPGIAPSPRGSMGTSRARGCVGLGTVHSAARGSLLSTTGTGYAALDRTPQQLRRPTSPNGALTPPWSPSTGTGGRHASERLVAFAGMRRLGLHFPLVWPLAEALAVVAGVPVRHDARAGRDLRIGEAFQRGRVIVLGVGEAHPSVCLCGHQNQLFVRADLAADEGLVHLHERCYGGRGEAIAPIG